MNWRERTNTDEALLRHWLKKIIHKRFNHRGGFYPPATNVDMFVYERIFAYEGLLLKDGWLIHDDMKKPIIIKKPENIFEDDRN